MSSSGGPPSSGGSPKKPRLKRIFSRLSSSGLQQLRSGPSRSRSTPTLRSEMTAARSSGACDLSTHILQLTAGDNGASSAANRLSAHFDVIDMSEVQDIEGPSPLYIPPFRRVAYRPAGIQSASRKRFLPRLWDAVAMSAVSQSRKKIKEMKLWPDFDVDAVDEWFPLDGEEGELVEDEGFLDALDSPSNAGSALASDAPAAVTTPSQPRKLDLINHLPPELALHVFLYLDLPSLAMASLVSRYWNGLSRDTEIWRDLFYRQPHWVVNPVKAARKRMRMNSRASRASSTFASPAALYSRWGRNSLLSLRSLAINDAPIFETPPLTLALDWADMYKSRLELDRRWAKGEPKVSRLTGHTDSVYCLEFDQYKIVTGSRDKTIKVWSLLSSKLLSTLRGHEGSVLCLKFESASGFMVTGSSDRQILVWDLNMLKNECNTRPRAALRGHTGGVLDLKLDEEWIVSCAKDTTVRLWSRTTFELAHTFAGHTGPVNAIDLSRASKRIISASGDGTLILWDIRSRSLLRTFSGHSRGLACVAFIGSALSSSGIRESCGSGEDELVVSGSNDKTIRVWHASSGECLCLLEAHESLVRALAYDALTGRLVSASYDQNVIIWDLKRTPPELEPSDADEVSTACEHCEEDGPKRRDVITATKLREFKGLHSSHIFDVKFDLTRIVSSSHDRKIIVLDFGCDIDSSIFVPD